MRSWAMVLAAMLAALLLSAAAFTTGAEAQDTNCKGQVVLDAGHGGTDSGAVSTKVRPHRESTDPERREQDEGPSGSRRVSGVHDAHLQLRDPLE